MSGAENTSPRGRGARACRSVLPLLCGLLLLGRSAAAEPADAMFAAGTDFLERIAAGQQVLQNTAVSPFAKEDKVERIYQRHERLKQQLAGALRDGKGRLELHEEARKRIDDTGFLILSFRPTDQPFEKRFESLGLLREKGKWKVAPMPGGFDQTLVGLDASRRQAAEDLVEWADARLLELIAESRQQAVENFRTRILAQQGALPAADSPVEEVVASFRSALQEGKLDLALAHCFEVRRQLQSEDLLDEEVTELAAYLADSFGARGRESLLYEYFVAPGCVVVPGPLREMANEADLIMFQRIPTDPFRFALEYELRKLDGRWFLKFPNQLAPGAERNDFMGGHEEAELIDRFGPSFLEAAVLRRAKPGGKCATAAELVEALTRDLKRGDTSALLAKLERPGFEAVATGLSEAAPTSTAAWLDAIVSLMDPGANALLAKAGDEIFAKLRRSEVCEASSKVVPVELVEKGRFARWYWASVDLAGVDRLSVYSFDLIDSGDGWKLAVNGEGPFWKGRIQSYEAMKRDAGKLRSRAFKAMMKSLESDLARLTPDDLEAPTEGDLRAAWRQIQRTLEKQEPVANSDMNRLCALLDSRTKEDPVSSLSDLANVIRGLGSDLPRARDTSFALVGRFGLVDFRVPVASGPDRALIFVFTKAAGRCLLLPEAQLEVARNYGRRIVNRKVWELLKQTLNEDEFKQIESRYQALEQATDEDADQTEQADD